MGGGFLSEDYKGCLLCLREQVGSAPQNLFTHPSACNYSVIQDIIIRSYYYWETQKSSQVLSLVFLLVWLRTNSRADTHQVWCSSLQLRQQRIQNGLWFEILLRVFTLPHWRQTPSWIHCILIPTFCFPLGTEFLCNEILDSVPEKEQNIPRCLLGEKGEGGRRAKCKTVFLIEEGCVASLYKISYPPCKQNQTVLAFIIVTIH